MRVDARLVLDAGGRELERVDGPREVAVPVDLAEREALADGRLVDLDRKDAGVGEVDDLVAERERELLALDLLRDVGTRERPVEDGDRALQDRDARSVSTSLGKKEREREEEGGRTVSMPFIGRLVSDWAYDDQRTVIGCGRETSETTMGGRT